MNAIVWEVEELAIYILLRIKTILLNTVATVVVQKVYLYLVFANHYHKK
jgi:hypothetical protein